MGIDITLYPEKASRKELRNYILSLNFEKARAILDWPTGTLTYSWFEYDDFKSITGISVNIYPTLKEELDITGNEWSLHFRALIHASWYDREMLNNTLRGARKLFGGKFYGDYGINRYIPLGNDNSTPISRGISRFYENILLKIQSIKHSLPEPIIKSSHITDKSLREFTEAMDPSRIIYNALIPFNVAIIEYFFSNIFKVLIKYDEYAIENLRKYNKKIKVDFLELLELTSKEKTPEDIIMNMYTFQNLNQINQAYKDWLKIDIKKILIKKEKIGNSWKYLFNSLNEIVEIRHKIVHSLELNSKLSKKDYLNSLEIIEKVIVNIVKFLEKKYNFQADSFYLPSFQ